MDSIFALSIQLKRSITPGLSYTLSDDTARALLVKLRSTYSESLIWYTSTRIGVWVVGQEADFLLDTFSGLKKFTAHMKVLSDRSASEFLNDIASGKKWRNYSSLTKYDQLCNGESLANVNGCFGETLKLIVRRAQGELLLQPIIYGSRHSWRSMQKPAYQGVSKCIIEIDHPELFYRFSIN
jgi:hypothetical protein